MSLEKPKKKRVDKESPFRCIECGETTGRRYDMEGKKGHIANQHGCIGTFTDCNGNIFSVVNPVSSASFFKKYFRKLRWAALNTPVQTAVAPDLAPAIAQVEPAPKVRKKKLRLKQRGTWLTSKPVGGVEPMPIELPKNKYKLKRKSRGKGISDLHEKIIQSLMKARKPEN